MSNFVDSGEVVIIAGTTILKSDFLKLEESYHLPEEYSGVEYKPGSHLYFSQGNLVTDMKSTEWTEGDRYIANLDKYLARLSEFYPTPTPTLDLPTEDTFSQELERLEEERKQAFEALEKERKRILLPDYSSVLEPYLYGDKKAKKAIADEYPYLAVESNVWLAIRNERNYLLKNSDWAMVPDNGLSDTERSKWISYRQELRDFPDKYKAKPLLDIPALTRGPA